MFSITKVIAFAKYPLDSLCNILENNRVYLKISLLRFTRLRNKFENLQYERILL